MRTAPDQDVRWHRDAVGKPPPAEPPADSRRSAIAVAAGLVVVVASYLALGLDQSTVDLLVEEDGLFEWAGAAGLLAGAVFFGIAAARTRSLAAAGVVSRLKPWVLGLLAFGLFVAAGEEISWGQRIFGIETPAALAERNVQQETNLHNLSGIEGLGDQLFQLFWFAGFVLLPAAAWAFAPVRRIAARYLPVAPIGVAVLLVATFVAGHAARSVFEGDAYTSSYPLDHSTIETKEGLVGVLLGVAGLLVLRRLRSGRPPASAV